MRPHIIPAITLAALATCALSASSEYTSASTVTTDAPNVAKFKKSLAGDCHIFREGRLRPVAADTFAKTRLFVVYYSHITCSLCIPVTNKLNAWLESGNVPEGVSVVLGYRAEADNVELAQYLKKSAIEFPAIDTKWMRARRANAKKLDPLYEDGDDGAPRFRFFEADGTEIDPKPHGLTEIYGGKPLDHFDKLLPKMLR